METCPMNTCLNTTGESEPTETVRKAEIACDLFSALRDVWWIRNYRILLTVEFSIRRKGFGIHPQVTGNRGRSPQLQWIHKLFVLHFHAIVLL